MLPAGSDTPTLTVSSIVMLYANVVVVIVVVDTVRASAKRGSSD